MTEAWISADQMRAELKTSGTEVSDSQIERWRRVGLLPRPKQIGKGRGRGSLVMVPSDSADQVREIARLYAIREKRDWVGWQLWMHGFTVDERYWRPALDGAQSMLCDVRDFGRKYTRGQERNLTEPTFVKAVVLKELTASPVGKALAAHIAKIDAEMLETLIGFGVEILSGKFGGFSADDAERAKEEAAYSNKPGDKKELLGKEAKAVVTAMGAITSESHELNGTALKLSQPIEAVLEDVSIAISRIRRGKPIAEPSVKIRREIKEGTQIGLALYRVGSQQLGRSALGLGVFNHIAKNPAITIHALILVAWTELRKVAKGLLDAPAISILHQAAAELENNISVLTTKR